MKPVWFDTSITGFKNAPDLSKFGMHSATLISAWGFFRTLGGVSDYSHIDMDTVRYAANHPTFWVGREKDMIVLDMEMLDLHVKDLPLRDHTHDQLIEAVQIYRSAHPGIAIGYYGEIPQTAYYPPLYATGDPLWAHYQTNYEVWIANNKHALTNLDDKTLVSISKGLCSAVDRVFPSCYSGSKAAQPLPANLRWWKAMHDGNVIESLQYQKPIIAYLSPQYEGRGEYFPAGVWEEMLQHSLDNPYTNGVCVYQAVTAGTEFDATTPWWIETLQVIGK